MDHWYSRPVLFVRSVEQSVAFYVDLLGFTQSWRYDEDSRALVAQVERQGCEIILSCQDSHRTGHGRLFISLDVSVLHELRAELEAKGVEVQDGFWGYDTMIVVDPDGNQLFFPYPNEDEDSAA